MNRERDCRIARGLGWTRIGGFKGDIRHIPHYSNPSQTGPLLEVVLEDYFVEWAGWTEAKELTISAIKRDRSKNVQVTGATLAEAVAELADKVLGRDE